MATTDIGAVAEFGSNAIKLAMNFLNPSQRKLMAEEEKKELSDENQFKVNLLEHDVNNLLLQLNGCVSSNPPILTSSESLELQSTTLNLDANTLLRLYACAKEADRLRAQLQIALTTTKS